MAALAPGQLHVIREVRSPAGLEELLAYLQSIPGLAAEGAYQMNNYSVEEQSGQFLVRDGDQPVFFADTPGEAYSFVAGLACMANEFLQRAIQPSQLLRDDSPDTP